MFAYCAPDMRFNVLILLLLFYIRRYLIYEMKVYGSKVTNHPTNKLLFDELTTLKVSGGFGPGVATERQFNTLRLDTSTFLEKKHPNLWADIETNRRMMIESAIQIIPESKRMIYDPKDIWTVIGCTQRVKRRSWLNLDDILAYCNTHYHSHRIVCVEVNVEKTNSPFEQLLLHRSLDILIGIHGAQVSCLAC